MNCSKKASFIIEGAKLQCYRNNHFTIRQEGQKFQIIRGTVYSMRNEPCEGAVVQVVQIDTNKQTRCLLGYAVTDEYGEYVFAIEALPWMIYELLIFSPLI